ncbi:MAG TPA: protein translocase subunit SecF [Gemmatimonadaceae bacterium]|nr:protein translocase subunit SecF [Gemmatimonadaceae bacterium]
MLRILHDTHIDFIKHWRLAVGITLAFILLGVASFAWQPTISKAIDFTGGTLVQVSFKQPPDVARLRAALEQGGIGSPELQRFGTPTDYTIRAQDPEDVEQQAEGAHTVAETIGTVLERTFGAGNYTIVRAEAVGPKVGSELARNALIAVLLSFGVTLLYLGWRFEWRFGLAAVVATGHDIFATLAFIKLMDLEISLTVIAAILTVIGYSLNDTIIIFDRARENLKKSRREPLYDTLNRSVNETLPRSVLTHATTLAATLALLILAGEVIRPFAWVMTFGIFTGTFSSIYVAPAVLLWIERRWPRTATASAPAPAGARQRRA